VCARERRERAAAILPTALQIAASESRLLHQILRSPQQWNTYTHTCWLLTEAQDGNDVDTCSRPTHRCIGASTAPNQLGTSSLVTGHHLACSPAPPCLDAHTHTHTQTHIL
jgi:hypothetical protein